MKKSVWKFRETKQRAKKTLKKNYVAMIIIGLIMAFICGAYATSTGAIHEYSSGRQAVVKQVVMPQNIPTNMETIMELFTGELPENTNTDKEPMRGVFGSVVNMCTQSSGPVMKVVRSVNQFVRKHEIAAGVILLVGLLVELFYLFFIRNLLTVGEKRFLLESRTYRDTQMKRVAYLIHDKKWVNPVKVMALRYLFQMLWWFTIVGGIIKYYEYRMIPYLLAEDCNMHYKEAFATSKAMMKGNKWRLFLYDLSFLGWDILAMISFGLVGIFWANPYKANAEAEAYALLREGFVTGDEALFVKVENGGSHDLYPGIPMPKSHSLHINTNYNRHYSITSLVLIFFSFSMIGWLWEVGIGFMQNGQFINRGVLTGPWLPIYGTGGLVALLFLKKIFDRPLVTFGAFVVVSGVIEYFTSFALEKIIGEKWWDYSGYVLNLNGRICVEGLMAFGIGGCACVYWVAPKLDDLFQKIPKAMVVPLCIVFVALFSLDMFYSKMHPNMGPGITTVISQNSNEKPEILARNNLIY